MNLKKRFGLAFKALIGRNAGLNMGVKVENRYKVVCHDKNGNLKWIDYISNLIVNVGLDDILDKYLEGSTYTAAHYMGLTDGTPTVNAADTMASHAGWVEVTAYDEGARQTIVWDGVASQSNDNSVSPSVFTISANSTTIGGAFVALSATKGESASTLYGAGAFDAGDKSLDDNDTLTVTITATAAAS